MLRTSLVGMTKLLDAKVHESKTIVPAAMYPAYVKGSDAVANYDYNEMANKPTIAGVVLAGDLSLADLGICEADDSEIEDLFK